jgi:flagellar motor protein MotB
MGGFAQAVGVLAPVTIGAIAMHQANKKAKEAEKRQFENEKILASLEASRQEIINPYENLAVATQAAEFEAEQADIALANTLDTLRATGAGAGGATALAQAALQSKQGISASIEKQEVQNQALKAQGEQAAFEARELREMQRLDRQAGLIERDMAQAMQYRADGMSALMGGVNASAQIAAAAYGGNKSGGNE